VRLFNVIKRDACAPVDDVSVVRARGYVDAHGSRVNGKTRRKRRDNEISAAYRAKKWPTCVRRDDAASDV